MANEAGILPDVSQVVTSEVSARSDLVSDASAYLDSHTKRLMDIVGSLLVLACLVFLMVGVAIAIKLSSPGPSLFRQVRHGRGKGTFLIYKFRSMRALPEQTFRQAVRNDNRVTRIGRFIRKTSIDEIPQLLNVIKGEMSLIGPRPHPLPLDADYATKIFGYDNRFSARPGMTGLAQVMGARGATPTVEHMRKRITLDVQYVREASLLLDLRILALTVKELFFDLGRDDVF